jgi:hypothetical protein
LEVALRTNRTAVLFLFLLACSAPGEPTAAPPTPPAQQPPQRPAHPRQQPPAATPAPAPAPPSAQVPSAEVPRWPAAWPGILHGTFTGIGTDFMPEYDAAMGKGFEPCGVSAFTAIPGIPRRQEHTAKMLPQILANARERGAVLNLGVGLVDGGRRADGKRADVVFAETAEYDGAIDELAILLRDSGVLVLLRLGVEINGSWNELTAGMFPKAWRKIRTRFHELGAVNVKFVWCVSPQGEYAFDTPDWFPGAEHVDFMGIDLFENEDFAPRTGRAANTRGRKRVLSFFEMVDRYRLPVVIGEASPIRMDIDPSKHAARRAIGSWFSPFFDLLRDHPEIKAVFLGPVDWVSHRDELYQGWGNARYDQNPEIVRWLRQEMTPEWNWQGFVGREEWARIRATMDTESN